MTIFCRAAVNPVWISPGWTQQTSTPKGFISFASAIVYELIAALLAD